MKREPELSRLLKAVLEANIVCVGGVTGSGTSELVSCFVEHYPELYSDILWYTPNNAAELQHFFFELGQYGLNFCDSSDHSKTKALVHLLNTRNVLLVIDDFHVVNQDSFIPLVRFSQSYTGPAHVIFISDHQLGVKYHSVTTVYIDGYSEDDARAVMESKGIQLTDAQFEKLKSQTSLLPFAVNLFINLCTSCSYQPLDLLDNDIPPQDQINAWVSCISQSFTEQEAFALQFIALNEASFDSTLIKWIADRHLIGADTHTILQNLRKPYILNNHLDGKYSLVTILTQFYSRSVDKSTKHSIYESLANYHFERSEISTRPARLLTINDLTMASKACYFYQMAGLFSQSGYIISKFSTAMKLNGQHSLLAKLCEYEIIHNPKRTHWVDITCSQAYLALGRAKDSFKALRSHVEDILFKPHSDAHIHKDVNKQIIFVRTFCEVLKYSRLYEIAVNILSTFLKMTNTRQAKWNVFSHAKAILADLYSCNGMPDKAIELNESLMRENLLAGHQHAVAIAQTRIGIAYIRKSIFEKAIDYLAEASEYFTSYDKRAYSWAQLNLAYAYSQLDRQLEAEEHLSIALDLHMEHSFIGDEYFDYINYFTSHCNDPDVLKKVSLEKERLSAFEEQRNIGAKDIEFSQTIEAIYLYVTAVDFGKTGGAGDLDVIRANATMRSRMIKTYVRAASNDPENVTRMLFEKDNPDHIFSIPLFNKFVTEACKKNSHLAYKYIKPNLSTIMNKSDSIKLHYARFLEYKNMLADAFQLLESVVVKDGFTFNNVMANCMSHHDFSKSMEYNEKALLFAYNSRQKARIQNNMAHLIYKFKRKDRYSEAIVLCKKSMENAEDGKYSARFDFPLSLLIKLRIVNACKKEIPSVVMDIISEYGIQNEYAQNVVMDIVDISRRNIALSALDGRTTFVMK